MKKVHYPDPAWGAFTACGRLIPMIRPGAPGRPAIYPKKPRKADVTCLTCRRVLKLD